jgi:inhibitor of nuclear factor kappa-B kinase subunit alpha
MLHLSQQDRIAIVQCYYASNKSSTAATRMFQTQRGLHVRPFHPTAVSRIVAKFETTGSIANRPKKRKSLVNDEPTVSEVAKILRREQESGNVTCSTTQLATLTGYSQSTVCRILKKKLRMRPYRMKIVQQLLPGDLKQRLKFSQWFLHQMELSDDFLPRVLWTDEAYVHLNGYINTKNCIIWGTEKPSNKVQKPLHPQKVLVWCGFTADFILTPFFIDGNLNGCQYVTMLRNHVLPQLRKKRRMSSTIFQQDGAPPHIAREVKELLLAHFGENRVISRHFVQPWPARSPDLNPADFWLWGWLKDSLSKEQFNNLEELKSAIKSRLLSVPKTILPKVSRNFVERLHSVIGCHGNHIE